ncbi:hypothetical protein GQR58_000173 [Nymphon striatum]|nr:hypothetical protein GQR58_000173 [Nymphon striatum]
MFDSRTRVSLFPESNIARVLIVVFVFSPVITVITNEEPVFFGQVGLPGLRWNDAIALIIQQFLLVLPLLLARQFLNTPQSHRDILVALIIGALGYSLLMLIEIRVSPQLNLWVYGFFPSSFAQSIRFGGYRPVVFLYHGLWVAFYVMTAVVAAFAMWRISDSDKSKNFLLAAMYLGTVLVMAKSTGAVLFAIMLVPMVVLLSPIMQIRVAALVALLAIGYPLAKGADIVPVDRMLGAAATIDPDRAASLEFRFDNENILMERAYIKPAFGWGSWGRNHILDPVSGNILTVTDGRWIIVIGVFGWIGFLAEFGLLTIPIFLLWREAILPRRDPVAPYIAPLSLILAFNIADMIPNATLTPLTWMMSGALLAYAEVLKAQRLGQGPIVLVIAEAANPEWVSVPLVGWSLASALRDVADVHIVTQIRNRDAFLRAGLVEGVDFTAIDSEAFAKPMWKLAEKLRMGEGKGWTTLQAINALTYPYFERLVWKAFGDDIKAGAYDVVHRVTPLSPTVSSSLAGRCAKAGIPFVLGTVEWGRSVARGVRLANGAMKRNGCPMSGGQYKLLPGRKATLRAASAILTGSRHTASEVPAAYQEKCVYLPENAIDPARFNRTCQSR